MTSKRDEEPIFGEKWMAIASLLIPSLFLTLTDEGMVRNREGPGIRIKIAIKERR